MTHKSPKLDSQTSSINKNIVFNKPKQEMESTVLNNVH